MPCGCNLFRRRECVLQTDSKPGSHFVLYPPPPPRPGTPPHCNTTHHTATNWWVVLLLLRTVPVDEEEQQCGGCNQEEHPTPPALIVKQDAGREACPHRSRSNISLGTSLRVRQFGNASAATSAAAPDAGEATCRRCSSGWTREGRSMPHTLTLFQTGMRGSGQGLSCPRLRKWARRST